MTVRVSRLPWERWQRFYSEVLDPLVREGADISVSVDLTATSESGIDRNTAKLGIKESLGQRGIDGEVRAD